VIANTRHDRTHAANVGVTQVWIWRPAQQVDRPIQARLPSGAVA
jgi:hypothetical protein